MDRQTLERALLAASRRTAAEVYTVSSERTWVSVRNNQFYRAESSQSDSLTLRMIAAGRLGILTVSDPQIAARPGELAAQCLETAPFGPSVSFAFPGPTARVPAAPLPDEPAFPELPPVADLHRMALSLVDRLRQAVPGVRIDAEMRLTRRAVCLMNSSGFRGTGRVQRLKFAIRAVLDGNVPLDIMEDLELRVDEAGDVLALAGPLCGLVDKLAERLARNGGAPARPEAGRVPVILGPRATAAFTLSVLTKGLSGATHQTSGLQPGARLLHPAITILDVGNDLTLPYGAAFDEEGTPTGRTMLVEGGVVAGFVHNLETAAQAGVAPTGNGLRGGDGAVAPGVLNLMIRPGRESLAELIRKAGSGLLVEQVMGVRAGAGVAGAFSGRVQAGWRIEGGQLAGPVAGTMLTGNAFQALSRVAGISDQGVQVGGRLYLPYLLIDELDATGHAASAIRDR